MAIRVTRSASTKLNGSAIDAKSKPSNLASKADYSVKSTSKKGGLPAAPQQTAGSKRKSSQVKKEDSDDELPHNLGPIKKPRVSQQEKVKVEPETSPVGKATKAATQRSTPRKAASKDVQPPASETVGETPKKSTTSKKEKKGNYGLTPGATPYPDWPHPTPEECHEVVRLLSSIHGNINVPKSIPLPSLTTSGCGEVPSVLDALIRTRLSAATSNTNSSRAFQGLVKRFGILKSGIGKGSVDWDAVRVAPVFDIFEAIKSGGLADVKSKDIKKILQMVYEENQERRKTLLSNPDAIKSEVKQEEEQKGEEVKKAEEHIISLDHLHLVPSEEAFNSLIKYPGIGPKTASCVLLFCLQRPSFAVDTHVFRICKWLGWVPPDKATRNSTYAHCEVRIPDDLKYPLHALMIKHGRTCPRCRAATGESSANWDEGCVIDHLVKRSGGRKGAGAMDSDGDVSPAKKRAGSTVKNKRSVKKSKKAEEEEEEEEEEDDKMSSESEGSWSGGSDDD